MKDDDMGYINIQWHEYVSWVTLNIIQGCYYEEFILGVRLV